MTYVMHLPMWPLMMMTDHKPQHDLGDPPQIALGHFPMKWMNS